MRTLSHFATAASYYCSIVKCFTLSKPLTPDQENFLDWHQIQLSDPQFDPVLKYYLKSRSDYQRNLHTSFLLPHEKMNHESIASLKKRLAVMLQANPEHRVVTSLTQEQFLAWQSIPDRRSFLPQRHTTTHYFSMGQLFWYCKICGDCGGKSRDGKFVTLFRSDARTKPGTLRTRLSKAYGGRIKIAKYLIAQ